MQMRTSHNDRAQATVITVLFLVVLMALAGAVVDVGSWYRADRQVQATVDAAALAGAQALPSSPALANALAVEYANKNGGGVGTGDISVTSTKSSNDTVSVHASRTANGVFTRIFGIDGVSVGASAKATTAMLASVKGLSPLAINETNPKLHCSGGPCYGQSATLQYHHPGSAPKNPLSVAYVNLIAATQSKITESYIANWIRDGYSPEMTTGVFAAFGDPTYLSAEVKAALESRFGEVILVPVIRTFGKNQYTIVSWAAFKVTGLGKTTIHHWEIYGTFVPTTAEGTEVSGSTSQPNYGVSNIHLVE
jgi:putative Flp pilus-assembly TadE/G-like protein